jgi:hypothetical protein
VADGYGLEAYFMAPNESGRQLRLEANFMAMTGGVSGLPLGAMLMAVAGVLRRSPYHGPVPQRLYRFIRRRLNHGRRTEDYA